MRGHNKMKSSKVFCCFFDKQSQLRIEYSMKVWLARRTLSNEKT